MASKTDYENALYELLPWGPAWPREFDPASTSQNFLSWIAQELTCVEADSSALFDEADPRFTQAFLDRWLEEWGLPNECMQRFGADYPRDQLRKILTSIIGTWGMTSMQAVNYIGQIFGKEVEVQNVRPYTVASTCNRRLYDDQWRSYVVIIAISDSQDAVYKDVTWTADQPLARWGDTYFECAIEAVLPAHLFPMFSYPDAAGGDGSLVFE